MQHTQLAKKVRRTLFVLGTVLVAAMLLGAGLYLGQARSPVPAPQLIGLPGLLTPPAPVNAPVPPPALTVAHEAPPVSPVATTPPPEPADGAVAGGEPAPTAPPIPLSAAPSRRLPVGPSPSLQGFSQDFHGELTDILDRLSQTELGKVLQISLPGTAEGQQ